MENGRILGLIGAVLLLAGLFLPLFSVPVLGPITFYGNAEMQALMVGALALASAALAAAGRARWLLATGLGAFGVMAATYVRARASLERMREIEGDGLQAEILRALADRAADSVTVEWGWAVLILGAGMVTLAGALGWRGERR